MYWRALGYVTRDYKYFVHLWHDEEIIAQVDSIPMKWQYPTSWWAPREIVSEKIVFDLGDFNKGEEYMITSGFYDPVDGVRLPVTLPDGGHADHSWITIQEVIHE